MSRAVFGERIGVSCDTINNMERGRAEIREDRIRLICSTFGVNREWLLDGEGDMFTADESFSLDEFIRQKGMNELEAKIIKAYFDLPKNQREFLIEHFRNKVNDPVQVGEDAYIKSRLENARKQGQSASNITDDAVSG